MENQDTHPNPWLLNVTLWREPETSKQLDYKLDYLFTLSNGDTHW